MNAVIKLFQLFNFSISFLFGNSLNEKKLLTKYIKDFKIVYFDIGANVGNDISKISKVFKNRDLEVHAFEPIGRLANLLKDKYPNIKVNNLAISDKKGVEMFYERKISSQSSFSQNIDTPLENIEAQYETNTETLKYYIINNQIEKIDFLKIDTEGHDFEALSSLEKFNDYVHINMIKIECLFKDPKFRNNSLFVKILNYMNENDFEIIGIPNLKHIKNEIFLADLYFKNKSL
jgi:FkbM family methyltransferase